MPHVRPFRAIRYTPAAGDLAALVAPPYDVIDEAMFRELSARSPYNVVRLILDRGYSRDLLPPAEWYQQAAALLREWLAAGILAREERPAFYLYTQRFTHEGRQRHHKLLLCALKLEDYETGRVRPHEHTTPGPKAGRLRLTRACRANLSPVLGFVPDDGGRLDQHLESLHELAPACRFTDGEGVAHELRLVVDPEKQRSLAEELAPLPFYIADGHHRYETALALKGIERYRLGNPPNELPSDYVFAACMSGSDPGLVILPTHRVVRWDGGPETAALWARARRHFALTALEASGPDEATAALAQAADPRAFVLYGGRGLGYALARLRDEAAMRDAPWPPASAVRRLPAAIFDHVFLHKLLGKRPTKQVDYTPEAARAVNSVDSGERAVACLLRGVRPPELISVVDSGERMPPKSTYFWPKPRTGMALRPLDDF